jgi:hypothetical protein
MTLHGNFGDPRTERDILSAKRFNFVALLVLFGLIVAAFLMYLQLLNQQRELQMRTQQLADSTASLRRIRSELEAAQKSLAERESRMEQQLQHLSTSVENHQFDSALVMAKGYSTQLAKKDSSETMLVNLYAWEPNPKVLHAFRHSLTEPEYLLANMETVALLPPWFDKQNTVHYYSEDAAPKAKELAIKLTKLSSVPFTLVKGNPDEVPKSDYHQWVRVYYLGTKPKAQ